jgi:homocysteine S-methyltransferase
VDSIGLIAILHNLNQGLDARGRRLAAAGSFFIGCCANPTAEDLALDLERLHQKIQNGAHYVMTQPVFDPAALEAYLNQYASLYGPLTVPVVMGLQPLHSYQFAEKFHHEVPGISIPQQYRDRLRAAGEAASETGVEIAREIFAATHPLVQGVYIMVFDRLELAGEMVPFVRECTQK